jgi:hypothetical protein
MNTAHPPVVDLHPDATALTVVRTVTDAGGQPHGPTHTIAEPVEATRRTLARFVRIGIDAGHLTAAGAASYAMLDVLDNQDSIVQNYGIRDHDAYLLVMRGLGLQPTADDQQ